MDYYSIFTAAHSGINDAVNPDDDVTRDVYSPPRLDGVEVQ